MTNPGHSQLTKPILLSEVEGPAVSFQFHGAFTEQFHGAFTEQFHGAFTEAVTGGTVR
jgi:hypothetical protein